MGRLRWCLLGCREAFLRVSPGKVIYIEMKLFLFLIDLTVESIRCTEVSHSDNNVGEPRLPRPLPLPFPLRNYMLILP